MWNLKSLYPRRAINLFSIQQWGLTPNTTTNNTNTILNYFERTQRTPIDSFFDLNSECAPVIPNSEAIKI
jgi:hypothetical protein